jgi:hypothetical protein
MPRTKNNFFKFPHFTREEREVAKLFYELHKNIYHGWQWEVRLKSKKSEGLEHIPENLRYMWEVITAKRIDVVFEDAYNIYIGEIKRILLPSGIGQLLLYKKLYQEQFKPTKKVQMYYIAYIDDPDVRELAEELGIKVWVKEKL